MDFFLPFAVPKSQSMLSYHQKVIAIGSCFAQEIGGLLEKHKFNVMVNPHGILFNSKSIIRALNDYMNTTEYHSNDLLQENNLWHSLHHHGRFSKASKQLGIEGINKEISEAHRFLKNADWLLVTLGTSWAFRHIHTNEIIANCHKIPQLQFEKEILNSTKQTIDWQEVIEKLRIFNPKIKLLFTVSPVRYIRDGLVENNLSKSHLLTTVHSIVANNESCFYFPAYELVVDVLRDYRFFKEDLVHPNEQAVNFVWEHFINAYLNPKEFPIFKEIDAFLKFDYHKPLNEADANFHREKREMMHSKILALLKAHHSSSTKE